MTGSHSLRIRPFAGQEEIEATKVVHLLPPFTHVLFGPISRSYQTGSWCKGLHQCICGFDLSPCFFSCCLSPCLILYLYPTVLIAVKEMNCRRYVSQNSNVLICFSLCVVICYASCPSSVSATISCTVSVRNIFVFVNPTPPSFLYFQDQMHSWI